VLLNQYSILFGKCVCQLQTVYLGSGASSPAPHSGCAPGLRWGTSSPRLMRPLYTSKVQTLATLLQRTRIQSDRQRMRNIKEHPSTALCLLLNIHCTCTCKTRKSIPPPGACNDTAMLIARPHACRPPVHRTPATVQPLAVC